jgi:hypothetical protein
VQPSQPLLGLSMLETKASDTSGGKFLDWLCSFAAHPDVLTDPFDCIIGVWHCDIPNLGPGCTAAHLFGRCHAHYPCRLAVSCLIGHA